MSEPKIGELLPAYEDAARDAVHIAVAPVIATERLAPGQHIAFVEAGNTTHVCAAGAHVGIVDPYLKKHVRQGEAFWMHLYPGTITSLRHNWTHSAFEAETSSADKWMRNYAAEIGLTYKDLMVAADHYLMTGEYLSRGGLLEGVDIPDSFWDNFESITRRKVAESDRGHFFSCSC